MPEPLSPVGSLRDRPSIRLIGLLILALAVVTGTANADNFDRLVERMQTPDLVLYFRHAQTDHRQRDIDLEDMARCTDQRNLDAAGRAQAQRIGQAFATLGIPVGQVLSSSYCRNIETAELAFGRHQIDPVLFNLSGAQSRDHARLVAALQQQLATPPEPSSGHRVLIGHNINLQRAAGPHLTEGEMAAFQPDPSAENGYRLLGRILPDRWPESGEDPSADR